jgi:hypothetical protein
MVLLGFEETIMAALGKGFRRKVEAAIAAETWEKRGTRRYGDCMDMAMGCYTASGGELVPVAGGGGARGGGVTDWTTLCFCRHICLSGHLWAHHRQEAHPPVLPANRLLQDGRADNLRQAESDYSRNEIRA